MSWLAGRRKFSIKLAIGLYCLGWRFSSARLRMVNDTVLPTSLPLCSATTQNREGYRGGSFKLGPYASAYNKVETNQPPQDLFISSI